MQFNNLIKYYLLKEDPHEVIVGGQKYMYNEGLALPFLTVGPALFFGPVRGTHPQLINAIGKCYNGAFPTDDFIDENVKRFDICLNNSSSIRVVNLDETALEHIKEEDDYYNPTCSTKLVRSGFQVQGRLWVRLNTCSFWNDREDAVSIFPALKQMYDILKLDITLSKFQFAHMGEDSFMSYEDVIKGLPIKNARDEAEMRRKKALHTNAGLWRSVDVDKKGAGSIKAGEEAAKLGITAAEMNARKQQESINLKTLYNSILNESPKRSGLGPQRINWGDFGFLGKMIKPDNTSETPPTPPPNVPEAPPDDRQEDPDINFLHAVQQETIRLIASLGENLTPKQGAWVARLHDAIKFIDSIMDHMYTQSIPYKQACEKAIIEMKEGTLSPERNVQIHLRSQAVNEMEESCNKILEYLSILKGLGSTKFIDIKEVRDGLRGK